MEPATLLKLLFVGVFVPLFGWEAITNIDNIKGHILFAILILGGCFKLFFYVVRQRQRAREYELKLKEMELKLKEMEDRLSDPTTRGYC